MCQNEIKTFVPESFHKKKIAVVELKQVEELKLPEQSNLMVSDNRNFFAKFQRVTKQMKGDYTYEDKQMDVIKRNTFGSFDSFYPTN